jgi:uncharacterized 2Fe-2S/4Fe-4S cluster protein (DUF4445 family)
MAEVVVPEQAHPVMHTILFHPSGVRGTVEGGISIRQAAVRLGVEVESICAETATCGKCRVQIEDDTLGNVRSSPDHASAMRVTEKEWIAKRADTFRRMGIDPDRMRLSCQATVEGDLAVFVPESSRAGRQIIRKAATDRRIQLDPVVRRYYLELMPPDLADPTGDLERVAAALVAAMTKVRGGEAGWEAPAPRDLRFDFHVIRTMGDALRRGDWKVSVTVRQDREVIDVRPGYHEEMYGIAVDIGSTAIAVYLSDLLTGAVVGTDSIMNPQTAYGDDIMSRMAYEKDHADGLATLRTAVVTGLNQVINRVLRTSRIEPGDVHELSVVGNTAMHHILLGISTKSLSRVPFVPAMHRAVDVKAKDLGIPANPAAYVHVLPIAASFVGADAMAVTIAEEPHEQDEKLLIIDIGTNAELIAGNRQRLICTSTPTGPAFEGAHIEHGMRAAEGAIERIDIDPDTLEARYVVIGGGPARGLAGSAIIDGVAEMFRAAILSRRGHFASGLDNPRVRQDQLGWEYVVAWADDTATGRDITITLNDVRQVQLAKAALYTAARILLKELDVTTPDKIILAGAFGSHIDKTKAMILGMIPDCPLDRVHSVGNAAGDGARIALLSRRKRLEAQRIATTIQRIELPVDPDFQNEYIAAMNFPHMDHHFTALEGLLPQQGPDPLAERLRS